MRAAVAIVVVAAGMLSPARTTPRASAPRAAPTVAVYFEENFGQSALQVDCLARCDGYVAFLTAGGAATFSTGAAAFRMRFVGASDTTHARGLESAPGRSNYFVGNDASKWVTDVPHFARVAYEGLLPGVDVVWRGDGRAMAYDVALAPGVDPATVRLRFEGADAVALDDSGAVVLTIPGGRATMSAPRAYQDLDAGRRDVAAAFVVGADGEVGFRVGEHDRSKRLVIDPSFTASTYLGGTLTTQVRAMTIDSSDSIFVTGWTQAAGFPLTTGAFKTATPANNNAMVFVTKFAPAAASLVYSSYLSSSYGGDEGNGIAVDSSGNAYVAGRAQQSSTNFPLVSPIQTSGAGFLLKLNPAGNALPWSTYVTNLMGRIRLDSSNNVYGISNVVTSVAGVFSTAAHVMKFAASGSSQVYDVNLSSCNSLAVYDIAVDPSGVAWAVGSNATSGQASSSAIQSAYGGGATDGWILRLGTSGSIDYKSYIGGGGADVASAVVLDRWGDVYVAGQTSSTDFPTSHAHQASNGGSGDVWVARLNSSATSLVWSTYLGGSSNDGAGGVAVNGIDEVAVVGLTQGSGFPTSGAVQSGFGGGNQDGLLAEFSSDGSLERSSYLGGAAYDNPSDVVFDSSGSPFVAGTTNSHDFAVTPSAFQTTFPGSSGGSSVFVTGFPKSDSTFTDVSPADLPGATVGAAYAGQLTVGGGTAPFTWSEFVGPLPAGTSLSSSGVLSGTPPTVGTVSFMAKVVDAAGLSAARRFRLTVNPLPVVATTALPAWTVGRPYAAPLVAVGGTPLFTWTLTSGTLPSDAVVVPTGHVAATALAEVGAFTFGVHVVDAWGVAADGTVTMTVNPAPHLTTTSSPAPCTESRPIELTFEAADGTAPFTWSVESGTAPVAAPIDGKTGLLKGTARAAGDYAFTVRATDVAGATADHEYSMRVNAVPRITSLDIPWAALNRPYSFTLRGSGGTPPLVWSVLSGQLPSGMTLDADTGALKGTPTTADRKNVLLQYSDSCGASDSWMLARPVANVVDLRRNGRFAESLPFTLESSKAPTTSYLELVAGTELTVVVKRSGGGALPVRVSLHDASQAEMGLGAYATTTKKRFVVRRFPVTKTGRYFLHLAPIEHFKGRLLVQVQATAPRRFTGTVDPTAGPATIAFSAVSGAKLVVTATAVNGGAASPTIMSVLDDSGAELLVPSERRESTNRVSLNARKALAGGDYSLTIASRDGVSGVVSWTVTLKSPKRYAFALPDLAVDGDD